MNCTKPVKKQKKIQAFYQIFLLIFVCYNFFILT